MKISYTVLKKKSIIGLMIFAGLIFICGGIYIFKSYFSSAPQLTTIAKSELPNGTNVTVVVNNFLDGMPHDEPKPNTIAPKLADKPLASAPIGKLMSSPLIVEETEKPNMLVVGNATHEENSPTNAITGTNTSVGTGEIDSRLTKLKSPYTIFAGTFLPATMVTGLNSDLNGVIVASIRNNIYDSATGKYLLIPQGARLVGTYNHEVTYAQNRLMVGWNRVIYPNGTSFLLRGQPGTDLQGASGFTGDVDNHYGKIFGSAFLMGLIFGGTTAAVGNQGTNPYQLSTGATIATQVGAQMSQAGLQVVSKGLNIPPTIVVSPGYKFNVLTTADLILKPYIYQ